MWQCPKCGESLEETFETCWQCGTGQDGKPTETPELFDPNSAKHLQPKPSRFRIWIRCWLIACLMFLGVFVLTVDQPHNNPMRAAWAELSYGMSALCGSVLFGSALLFSEGGNLKTFALVVGVAGVALLGFLLFAILRV